MALNFPHNPSVGQKYYDTTSEFNYEWDGIVWQSFSPAGINEIKTVDDISSSFNGVLTSFNLTSNSVALVFERSNQIRIVLDDVIQKPDVDYIASSSSIAFTTAPAGGLSFSGILLGGAVPITSISDGAVTPTKLSTGGPYWDTSGNINITGIATASSFRGDGSQLTGIDATALKDINGDVRVQADTSGAIVIGIITATDATFSGNVSIGGTLTYEDVTNIDSVGLITARSGIRVGAGKSIGSDGAEVVYYGDGSNLSGIDASSLKDSGSTIRVQANTSGAIVTGILTATTSTKVGAGITIDGTSGITLNEATNASQIINPVLVNYSEKVNALGNTGANATIDLKDGTYVTATLSETCTFAFTSPPSGNLYGFVLQLTNGSGGAYSITWPGSVKWPGGSVPTRTTTDAKSDIWSFFTSDGGTNWYGALSLFNFS